MGKFPTTVTNQNKLTSNLYADERNPRPINHSRCNLHKKRTLPKRLNYKKGPLKINLNNV